MWGGGVGFPLGQSIQAFHAWNAPLFSEGLGARVAAVTNWWNFMETTFGATWGGAVGLGLWWMRGRISGARPGDEVAADGGGVVTGAGWPTWAEAACLGVHGFLLVAEEFTGAPWAAQAYDFGMLMVWLPLVAVAGGRRWPWWVMFPVVLAPIAGKTFKNLALDEGAWNAAAGACVLLVLPWVAAVATGEWLRRRAGAPGARAGTWLGPALMFAACLYFGLNFAFFRFPWPWATWTARTPNALVYVACLALLAWAARRETGPRPTR